jgi:uncharacterized protein (TIGR00369 family)
MHKEIEGLTPMAHAAQSRCFGCGPANAAGLQLEFYLAQDGSVVSFPAIAERFEGPPTFLHGGIIATLLDEAMSKAVRATGVTAMTRQMEVDYRRPVPSATQVRMEGRVVRNEGRKHWTEAQILNDRGVTLASATGLFVEVRASRMLAGHTQERTENT